MASQDPALLRRLLRAKDRMDAASEEDWPVERLANVSGGSDAHFARSFKEAFGVPPHRYLLTRRIERAKALLRDSDAPIIEIALQTGWKSLGTFGRVFRDVTGESPSELRARASRRAPISTKEGSFRRRSWREGPHPRGTADRRPWFGH
jgi:transcriptional regulator GlxA family with amidase domain